MSHSDLHLFTAVLHLLAHTPRLGFYNRHDQFLSFLSVSVMLEAEGCATSPAAAGCNFNICTFAFSVCALCFPLAFCACREFFFLLTFFLLTALQSHTFSAGPDASSTVARAIPLRNLQRLCSIKKMQDEAANLQTANPAESVRSKCRWEKKRPRSGWRLFVFRGLCKSLARLQIGVDAGESLLLGSKLNLAILREREPCPPWPRRNRPIASLVPLAWYQSIACL